MRNWPYLLALLFASAALHGGWDPDEEKRLLREAELTVQAFLAKDPSLSRFFDNAAGWAVFPTVGKGGFVLGGAYGKGVLYVAGGAAGFTELRQVTLGLQLGGQAYSELLFLRDQAALARFQSGKLEFDAQVSAVVIDQGVAANADYHAGVAVFTLAKGGLMAEASVGGQSFSYQPR